MAIIAYGCSGSSLATACNEIAAQAEQAILAAQQAMPPPELGELSWWEKASLIFGGWVGLLERKGAKELAEWLSGREQMIVTLRVQAAVVMTFAPAALTYGEQPVPEELVEGVRKALAVIEQTGVEIRALAERVASVRTALGGTVGGAANAMNDAARAAGRALPKPSDLVPWWLPVLMFAMLGVVALVGWRYLAKKV